MSAFGTPTVLQRACVDGLKIEVVSVAGTASYDTGGSVIDLSAATLGAWNGFNEVYSVSLVGSSATNSKYAFRFVPAASGAPATGLLKVHDQSQAADAEASAAADLSASTFYLTVIGR